MEQENKIQEIIEKNKIKVIIFVIISIIIVIISLNFIENKDNENINIENLAIETTINENTEELNEISTIKIHVSGEVKNQGIYELEEGSRISDAIDKAGGITVNADMTNVNLAYELEDGQKIIIPSINKEEIVNNTIIDNCVEYGSAGIVGDENNKSDKININTASLEELQTLSGIGESTAQKIISYREQNGKFKEIEDIKNVSGIGDSKFNQIMDFIKVK